MGISNKMISEKIETVEIRGRTLVYLEAPFLEKYVIQLSRNIPLKYKKKNIQRYYLSTGTSNPNTNFPNTFFPNKSSVYQWKPLKLNKSEPIYGWFTELYKKVCTNSNLIIRAFGQCHMGTKYEWRNGKNAINLGRIRKIMFNSGFIHFMMNNITSVATKLEAENRIVIHQKTIIIPLRVVSKHKKRTGPRFPLFGGCWSLFEACEQPYWLRFIPFLRKFGVWEHLQQSAMLGGNVWDSVPFEALKFVVLNWDFEVEKQNFEQREHPLKSLSSAKKREIRERKTQQFKFTQKEPKKFAEEDYEFTMEVMRQMTESEASE